MEVCLRTGKVRHKTKAKAHRALRSLKLRTSRDYQGEAYRCQICGDWHFGKQRPKAR